MKKMILFAVTLMLPVLVMTSCLGDTGNRTSGDAVGVLTFDLKSGTYVLKSSAGVFAAPEINAQIAANKMVDGGCYYFGFQLDYDLPENSYAMIATNGYMVITLLNFSEVPQSRLYYSVTDTLTVLGNEIVVTDPLPYAPALADRRYMFLYHVAKHQDDLKVNWEMSCDYSNMTPIEEGGYRIYELYLRAVANGSSSKPSLVDTPHFIAYEMGSYLESVGLREKAAYGGNYDANTAAFKLRLYYASEIKDGVITWKYKDTGALSVAALLPSTE